MGINQRPVEGLEVTHGKNIQHCTALYLARLTRRSNMKIDRVAKSEFLPFAADFAGAASSAPRGRPAPSKAAFVELIFVTVILVLLATPPLADAASSSKIPEGAVWSYLIETGRGPRKWNHIRFDESKWPKGPSGFGFGRGKHKTRVDALKDSNKKIFVRHAFVVNNPHKVKKITLSLVSDGPFVAHINGIEVFRSTPKVTEAIDITGFAHELFPGTNILAIETQVANVQSDSFSFIPSLEILEN
jgi:hypothetical protein